MSSRHKLQLALVAGALGMMVLLGHLIWSGYSEAIHAAKTTTRGYAAILEARLDATLRRADAELQHVARDLPVAALSVDAAQANASEINAILDKRVVGFPELEGIRVFNAEGELLYSTNKGKTVRANIADRVHFRKARDSREGELVFSDTLVTRATGKTSLVALKALRDAQGTFLGVVTATFQFEYWLNLFQSLDVGASGNVALYRRDHFKQVLRWPALEGKLNVPLPPGNPAHVALAGGKRTATVEITTSTDLTTRFYSFHTLDPYPFFVAVGVARDDVLAGWRRRTLGVGLSTLLLVGLLIGLLYRLWRADRDRAGLVAIVEASNDAIVSRDASDKILSWNRGAELLFGYRAEEIIGRDIGVIAPQSLQHEIRLGEDKNPQFQTRAHDSVRRAKDGRLVDVSISAAPIRDAAGSVEGVALIFRDISERKQTDRAQAQLAAIVASSSDAIVSRAPDDTIVSWNVAAEQMFGWRANEVIGQKFRSLLSRNGGNRRGRFEKVLRGETVPLLEDIRLRKDGSTIHVETALSAARDEHGKILFVSCIMRDISDRMAANLKIEQLATKDPLTGLYNRNMLMEQMQAAIARAARTHTQMGVMFVDLDKFKSVNDTFGHTAGDELLRLCAGRLTECVREMDIVARLGGDEFMVMLTEITDPGIVSPIADRMIKLLTTPYTLQGHEAQTSASIGICFYPEDGTDVTALMKNADIAMYHAKEQGRNNYQFYAEEMNQRMLYRVQLERELRAALVNNEFVLHYQPQIAVATGEIEGVESLVRWQHPTRGLLSPGEFIPAAEEAGLIVPIGEWVLNHACQVIKAWRAKGVAVRYVVVNVSAAQLNNGLVDLVRQALVVHGIEPGWLMLEITETMLMERVEEAISILRRIRELGIRIAMDDFGTGYSSLSVLQRLPLDTLKIDGSFVRAIDDESDNARAVAIIGAIIAIAKELNLSVVAEGVESPTQLAFLRTLNCDSYQGYLFSEPVDTITLEARVEAPENSVLVDAKGRATTMTMKVTMELLTDAEERRDQTHNAGARPDAD